MSTQNKLDAFDMLIKILRDHDEKLEDLSARIEAVSNTLRANPELAEMLDQLELPQDEEGGAPSVLIVDDDDALAESFQMILKSAGFRADVASSGEGASVKAVKGGYDLAILDLNLPDMLGDELAARIGEYVKDIIFITGYGDLSGLADPEILREREFLLKPIEPADLIKLTKDTIALSIV